MAATKNQYPPQPISLYEAERALSFIEPREREVWLRMGAALKSEFGEEAKETWLRWSQQDQSFNAKSANSVWKSLRAGYINIGSLIYEAKRYGYQANRNTSAPRLTPEEIMARKAAQEKAAQEEALKREKETREAKALAKYLFGKGRSPDPKHPYLVNKQITDPKMLSHIRQLGKMLLIPAYRNQEITGLQKINPDGGKYFGYAEQLNGSSLFIGSWEDAKKNGLLMAEGYATAASLRQATNQPVLITFHAYNLVAMAERIKDLGLSVTICADDDSRKKGTGLIYAKKAAEILGDKTRIVIPQFTEEDIEKYQTLHGKNKYPTDFNDLHALRGIDALTTFFKEQNMEKEQQTPAQVQTTPAQSPQRQLTSIRVEFAESAKDHNGKTFNDAQQLQDWFKSIYDEQRQLNTQGYSKVFLVLEDNQNTQHKVRIDVGRDDYDPYIETPQERLSSYQNLKDLDMSNFAHSNEHEIEENSINFDYERSRTKALNQYSKTQVTPEETTFKATTQTQKNEKEFKASTEKAPEQQPNVAEQSMPKEVEEYFASRYTLDHNYVPRPPQSLAERYFASDEYYFDTQTQTSIFLDKGDKLSSARSDRQTIADMLEVAKAKGWDNITLKGTNEFKRQAFLEAESQGISTTGYTPTKEDQALLKHLINMRALNSVEKGVQQTSEKSVESTEKTASVQQQATEGIKEVNTENRAPEQHATVNMGNHEPQTAETMNLTAEGERKFGEFIQTHLKEGEDITRIHDDMMETLENQQIKQEPLQYTLHWSQTNSGRNETLEFNQHDIDMALSEQTVDQKIDTNQVVSKEIEPEKQTAEQENTHFQAKTEPIIIRDIHGNVAYEDYQAASFKEAVQNLVNRLDNKEVLFHHTTKYHFYDLNGLDFREKDISGVDFKGLCLDGSKFDRADARGCNFSNCDILKTQFPEANVAQSNFTNVRYYDNNLAYANHKGIIADEHIQKQTSSHSHVLDNIFEPENKVSIADKHGNILYTDHETTDFRQALENAVKRGVNLENANLSNHNLSGLDLSGGKFKNADFSNSVLSWSNLQGADVENADFSGTYTYNVNATQSNLTKDQEQSLNYGANIQREQDQEIYLTAQADKEASTLVVNNEIPTVGQINESWVADTQEFVSTQEIGGAEIDPDVLAAANRLRDAGKHLMQNDRSKLAAHIQVASNITKHLQGDFKAHAVRNLEENLAKSMSGDRLMVKDPLKPQQSTQQSQEQTREERGKSMDISR